VFQNEVNWWHIEGNMTSTKLVLPSGADSAQHVFGIAVQTMDGHGSGVVWHLCTYRVTASEYYYCTTMIIMLTTAAVVTAAAVVV